MSYQHDAGQSSTARSSGYGGDQSRFGFGRSGGQRNNKKGLLGLQNLGNTCFMNAALQCLTHTHGMQKYFRTCSHAYNTKGQNSRQKLLMAFAHWFERDWGKNTSANYHTPEDILRSVQQLNPTFQGYSQQDSQEFLRCVLDNIHEELRKEIPDDLTGHLRRSFGIEAFGEHIPVGITASSQSSQRSRNESRSDSSQAAASRSKTSPTSSARQFMQLCQSTEGVTDVGEIRLPEAPPLSSSGDFSCDGRRPGGKGAMGSDGNELDSSDQDSTHAPSSGSTKSPKETQKEEEEEKTHFSSIISELFQGRVVSVVQCLECNQTSKTHEVIYDLSVPIPNANEMSNGPGMDGPMANQHAAAGRGGGSWNSMFGGFPGKVKGWFLDKGVEVTDCIRKYCAPEFLGGKDKVFCERCKRKNDCEKRIAFKELPEVLCVHIKRFRYDAGWFNGTKNSKVVTFPVNRALDMGPFLDEPPPHPVEYKLVGLIQHIGSMGGGHYISYCQHKRKPQDWYEYDDMQVQAVHPEQVERAEPYVLFYQRPPSKGCKHDRLTFKNDRRLVESQIQTYLMNRTARQLDSADNSPQMAMQSVAEEMRHHGPALRNLYKKPPADLDLVFVSKHWYCRLTTMSEPGPLDNFMYLCPHQLLGSHSAEMAAEPFIPISRNLWQSLVKKYGGGPVINSLELCPKCQIHIRAYNERKQAEYDLVSKYDTKDTGEGKFWYLVDALWVNKWKRYVRGEHVTDISDVQSPGQITNKRLLDKETGRPREKLKLRVDYIGVNARVWWLFMHVHGGGPSICRDELDMYSPECSPETNLCLEELQGPDAVEYSRRISRQFVDEFHGNLEAYDKKYGATDQMQVDLLGDDQRPKSDMEDIGMRMGQEELNDSVRKLTAELDEIRHSKTAKLQECERQITSLREDLQLCQSRQRQLREGGHEEQLVSEMQNEKMLQQRLDQSEKELLAEQRRWDESISATEEVLRQCKLRAAGNSQHNA